MASTDVRNVEAQVDGEAESIGPREISERTLRELLRYESQRIGTKTACPGGTRNPDVVATVLILIKHARPVFTIVVKFNLTTLLK